MISTRVQKAIDIFIDALNNGTLAKGDYNACAVGNLISHSMGLKANSLSEQMKLENVNFWMEGFSDGKLNDTFNNLKFIEKCEITGFTVEELCQIEGVFEKNTDIGYDIYCFCSKKEIFEDQLRGLSAVIELMKTFSDKLENNFSIVEVFTNKAIVDYEKRLC